MHVDSVRVVMNSEWKRKRKKTGIEAEMKAAEHLFNHE